MWVLSISTFHSVVHCSVDKWQHYLIEGRVWDSIYLDIPLLDNRSSERPNFTVSPVHCVLTRGDVVAGHDKGNLYIQTSLYFHCNVHGQKKGNILIIWKVILTVLIIIFTVSVCLFDRTRSVCGCQMTDTSCWASSSVAVSPGSCSPPSSFSWSGGTPDPNKNWLSSRPDQQEKEMNHLRIIR